MITARLTSDISGARVPIMPSFHDAAGILKKGARLGLANRSEAIGVWIGLKPAVDAQHPAVVLPSTSRCESIGLSRLTRQYKPTPTG